MAIEGPLRELALPDVLQLVYLSRKTGTLTVRSESAARPGRVFFEQGAVVGAQAPGESSRLGRLLLMAGKVTAAQVERTLEEQRRAPGRLFGELLVTTQGVASADVERLLRFQVEETVFELVRWTDGYFRFEETPPLETGLIGIRLATESLLMEALRRVDEWTLLASGQPDTTLVPRLVEGEAAAGPLLTLQPQEWEVLAAIDGERTLRSLARELGRAEFEVAKALFSLVSAGIVELRQRQTRPRAVAAGDAGAAGAVAEAEAELREGRVEAAEARLKVLAARYPDRGDVLLLRGRVAAQQGRWGEAAREFESAIQRDPLLSPAYYQLGVAAARTGELDRAQDALTTYARLPDSRDPARGRAARAAELLRELRRILEEQP